MESKAKSLYVHVPFCEHICAYCDFMRVGYHPLLVKKYLDALAKQLQPYKNDRFDTIYIGGGTPTSLNEDEFSSLLSLFTDLRSELCEMTLEANPENFSEEKIKMAVHYGVNRISLGVQTTHPHLLKIITRTHQPADVSQVIELCIAHGLTNLSLDAMYGLPFQKMEDFESTLEWMIAQNIPHISLYALTIEPNSAFGRQKIEPVDNELEGQFYLRAIEILTAAGYSHYEISNFAKNDQMSKHNLAYWHYDDFVAMGPGGSGKEHHQRYTNTRNLETYFNDETAKDERIELSVEDEMFETMMMGLRVKEGVSLTRFYQRYGVDPKDIYPKSVKKYSDCGWLRVDDTSIALNETGRQFLHDVLVDMMDEVIKP